MQKFGLYELKVINFDDKLDENVLTYVEEDFPKLYHARSQYRRRSKPQEPIYENGIEDHKGSQQLILYQIMNKEYSFDRSVNQ